MKTQLTKKPHFSGKLKCGFLLSWRISIDADRTGTPQGRAAQVRRRKRFAQQTVTVKPNSV